MAGEKKMLESQLQYGGLLINKKRTLVYHLFKIYSAQDIVQSCGYSGVQKRKVLAFIVL